MSVKKLALALFIATIIVLYFAGGGQKYFSIDLYQDLFERSPISTAAIFFTVFFVGTSCSLPITAVLTLASGIVFGTLTGFALSLAATTLGGTVALYSTRFLFYDLVERRFTGQIEMVNKGIEKEGAFYLFGLRMIPVIPFWLLNLVMGLTSMRVPTFMLATFCGMMPVLLIVTYTGNELGDIESFSFAEVFTPDLIVALCLLASFPLMARLLLKLVQRYLKSRE
ncbi:MAG: VTT domain-containing protein [Xanthomonadales bacterium]|nr:VTT domain-containing protein [Xanthomonadales bacterium]